MIDNKEITEKLNAIEKATPRGKTLAKRLIKYVLEEGDVSGDDLKAKMSKGKSGMTKNEYNTARSLAIETGLVDQVGERRGARYVSNLPKEGVVEELRKRFKEVFVMYDNDFDSSKNRGRIAGAKLADQTGFLQIEVPDGCGIKDPSDYRSEFGEENLRNLILKLIKTRLREEELKQII